jgi:hypothetical protein
MRPKLDWYDDMLDTMKKTHKEVFNSMKLLNTSRIDVISIASQEFEQDGVHLTKAAGRIFMDGIMKGAENIFKAGFIDISEDDPSTDSTSNRKLEKIEWRLLLMRDDGTTIFYLPGQEKSWTWPQTNSRRTEL